MLCVSDVEHYYLFVLHSEVFLISYITNKLTATILEHYYTCTWCNM